jgi:hypothetical protein
MNGTQCSVLRGVSEGGDVLVSMMLVVLVIGFATDERVVEFGTHIGLAYFRAAQGHVSRRS